MTVHDPNRAFIHASLSFHFILFAVIRPRETVQLSAMHVMYPQPSVARKTGHRYDRQAMLQGPGYQVLVVYTQDNTTEQVTLLIEITFAQGRPPNLHVSYVDQVIFDRYRTLLR